MIRADRIAYTDECDKEYIDMVDSCKTLKELKNIVALWKPLCLDAYRVVMKMTAKDFAKFLQDRKKEKKGIFTNNNQLMIILMPEILIRVSIVARKFNAPWGVAYHRMKELDPISLKLSNEK